MFYPPYGAFHKVRMQNLPLIRTCPCAYQEVKNATFSVNCAYVLYRWPLRVLVDASMMHLIKIILRIFRRKDGLVWLGNKLQKKMC